MYNRAVLAHWREIGVMPTIEERVAYLEGRFGDHIRTTQGIQGDIADLRVEMNRRFEQIDRRFEHVDRRFEQFDRRFEQFDRRFEHLDGRLERLFTWGVGLQVGTLVAVIGVLVGAYYK